MIRVAMLSFWHVHAKDYARLAAEHPGTEIVAVWDEIPERGRQKAEEHGVKFYEDLHELLAEPDIDAVIVDTPTNRHRDVIIAAAKAGKHIFTEKVIATTTKECNEILAAVETVGVKLTVSLPRLYTGFTQAARNFIQEGLLGTITTVRIRLAHNGALRTEKNPNGSLPSHFFNLEECGGGALMDLGCHPMYLTRLFLGLPESVSASFGYITEREVEDSAVAILRYPNGALGIVEAGFVNSYSQFDIEVQGTKGSLMYTRTDDKLLIRSAKLEGEAAKGWQEVMDLPSLPSAFEQWVSHITYGTTASENIQIALDLTRLMEASTLSARSGAVCRLSDLVE
ncbi:1,5-anhydro-D-fructose reductase (1,5-anhydro-D-mannitol-forming) [Paenibacillus sp. V4I3]|uniref:Gfo/Idh/MocA family protein n=1 Tax=unclassified Paenibacillus TaxID=185978 RepID=UPI002783F02D|nr:MULTISPECIES: Gfo/Idh/MocA family oxidoreductase [unclassified Paenibacillus]MDQ0871881.1 1,5-anhydro-D-fructose reductase (1,5-anhydro-D-mannitol-forming) [Paenibacillus sp. V4I3]MDQ0892236.1 1,5-anhydro-D-fructose reductase (1,5-anhydro-D-mannitol-forming) [Paenibacillus sp. V4I9]